MLLQLKFTHNLSAIFVDPLNIMAFRYALPTEVKTPEIEDDVKLTKTDHPPFFLKSAVTSRGCAGSFKRPLSYTQLHWWSLIWCLRA